MNKNEKIKESFLKTREKRQHQQCVVYTIKLVQNKLNRKQQEQLKMLFVEAKWLANDILNWAENNNLSISDYKISNSITKKNLDGSFEKRNLEYLGSQMKQSVLTDVISSIKGLSKLKKNGNKIGKLKYKSDYKSINLKQFGITYKIQDKNNIKIQNVSGNLYTKGLTQIPNDVEFANAKLLNTPCGYFLAITCYRNKINNLSTNGQKIGIDMGIKNALTLSNGITYNTSIQETDRLKRLQRQLNKKKKASKNRCKHIMKIQKEYQKMNNKKRNEINKIFHDLKQYDLVVIQDEMIKSWKEGFFGKQIQHSFLGKIKEKIKAESKKNNQFVVISKKHKTTQMCCECGKIHKMELEDRIYQCSCGNNIDRDINSAKNILKIGLEQTELTPVEMNYSSLKQEATKSLAS